MLMVKKSPMTGSINSMELPITKKELAVWSNNGGNIQDIFPHLSPSQREFIKTGITDKEWTDMLGELDE